MLVPEKGLEPVDTQQVVAEMMAEQRAAGRLAKQGDNRHNLDIPVGNVLTLDDIGVSRKQSADWGKLLAPGPRRNAPPLGGNAPGTWRASTVQPSPARDPFAQHDRRITILS